MGDFKETCPACDAWTNSVGLARRDGEPCPYCGLPAEVANAVRAAAEKHYAEEFLHQYAEAERRAAAAEREVGRLRVLLMEIGMLAEEREKANA